MISHEKWPCLQPLCTQIGHQIVPAERARPCFRSQPSHLPKVTNLVQQEGSSWQVTFWLVESSHDVNQ